MDFARELARQAAAGAFSSRFGAGIDQVGNGFGLCQVELVVQKCPLAELARLGQAQARQHCASGGVLAFIGIDARLPCWHGLCRHLQATCQQQLQHHGSAMGLQFQHVFARERMRPRKPQRQPVIEWVALRVVERQVGGFAWLEWPAFQHIPQ